jgi:hypothetical protein
MQTEPPEKRIETGRSVLMVRNETKARLDQLMKEANIRKADDIISLLIDHYMESRTTAQPSFNQNAEPLD